MAEKCLFEQLWKDKEAVLKVLSKGPSKRKIKAIFNNAVGDIQRQIEEKKQEIVANFSKIVEVSVKSESFNPEQMISCKEDIAQLEKALVYLQELYSEFLGKELNVKIDDDEE